MKTALTLIILAVASAGATPSFSHMTHESLKLKCVTCHSGATTEERANLPSIDRCRTCHPTMGSRTWSSKLTLADFVIFSHSQHAVAKIECNACHGEVARQSTTIMKPTKMKACVDCHKQHKATIACNACHELGQ